MMRVLHRRFAPPAGLTALAVLTCLGCTGAPPERGDATDSGAERIVAEVNGTPIYGRQLERARQDSDSDRQAYYGNEKEGEGIL